MRCEEGWRKWKKEVMVLGEIPRITQQTTLIRAKKRPVSSLFISSYLDLLISRMASLYARRLLPPTIGMIKNMSMNSQIIVGIPAVHHAVRAVRISNIIPVNHRPR